MEGGTREAHTELDAARPLRSSGSQDDRVPRLPRGRQRLENQRRRAHARDPRVPHCHAGANAKDKLPSDCLMCHQFHLPGRGLFDQQATMESQASPRAGIIRRMRTSAVNCAAIAQTADSRALLLWLATSGVVMAADAPLKPGTLPPAAMKLLLPYTSAEQASGRGNVLVFGLPRQREIQEQLQRSAQRVRHLVAR